MKILIYSDPHWCTYSSILRKRGSKYSLRLHNLIDSLNWIEELALKEGCQEIICAGDFFDRPNLSDEEISALNDIKFSDTLHTYLVGNHESSVNGLEFNSVNIFGRNENYQVFSTPMVVETMLGFKIGFLPYIIEEDRKKIKDYFPEGVDIIISHNDIKGFRFGAFVSQEGFDIKDIEDNCKLYLNGHLHNGSKLTDKIVNIGNLTGQNFSEDAFNYKHGCYILDTETLKLTFYENPYAFNFYKTEIKTESDISKLDKLSTNAILSFRCKTELLDKVKTKLSTMKNIIDYRLISFVDDAKAEITQETEIEGVDHLEQYSKFILETLGDNPIVKEELSEVIK